MNAQVPSMSTDRIESRAWICDWLWLLAFGVVSSVWCLSAARELGATFDEPLYVAKGLERWRTGSHAGLLVVGTMPLPVDLDTLPIYLWERWHGVQLDPETDLEAILPWARAGTLVFWWLLLVYARLAGRLLAGPWGGRLAVALLACEPSLLAHATLATTDIAVSACLLALAYHFRTGRDAAWRWRVGVPALWFAAAVLAKASGPVFGILCLLVIEIEYRLTRPPAGGGAPQPRTVEPGRPTWAIPAIWATVRQALATVLGQPFRRDVFQIVAIGMALTFVYCGCDWKSHPDLVRWAHQLPQGQARDRMIWLADHLGIFSNAGEGLVRQIKHNIHGHGAYLLGKSDPRAIWYYFPVVLTIKLSLGLLALLVALVLARPRALVNWACLAALALLVFSLTCRVQIGVRLVLPLVVVGVVGLAGGVVWAWQRLPGGWRKRLLMGTATACVAWTVLVAVRCWPHGLCYINELWGGTPTGYRLLSDSNYDWGQGLRELARWQHRHGVASLDVWYFGSDPLLKKLPMRHVPLHDLPTRQTADVRCWLKARYLAVGITLLYGCVIDTPEHRRASAFLHQYRPVDRTTTFLIFDLSAAPSN
jgi:hypothetical protein